MSAERADELERSLEAQIDPWLEHMRWRADFAEWRQRRVWQENYQGDALAELRHYRNGADSTRVLDLGAGMGGFAVALAREGERAVALDYNCAYCAIARTRARRYALDLAALVGAGEALPFAAASFEVVTCWDVLEHVQDPHRLLSEIARVLTRNGLVFITVINRLALTDPHYHLRFVNWMPRAWGETYIEWRQRTKKSALRDRQTLSEMHYFTYGAFEQLVAQYDFTISDLNESQSRFKRYPQPIGDMLYRTWRTLGMGTFRVVLRKNPSPSPPSPPGRGAGGEG